MVSSKLSAFQLETLEAIFKRADDSLFLTGGAALAGFHAGTQHTTQRGLPTAAQSSISFRTRK